jgi:rubrerythrin
MPLSKDNLMKYAEIERLYAKELRDLASRIRHPLLSAMITAISKDSEKHSLLYEALAELVAGTQPMLSEEELKMIVDAVSKHVESERRMISLSKALLNEAERPESKLILAAILEDEVSHHKILEDIRDKIAKAETYSEEELWDAVWKESPWHGAPGG